MGALTSLTALFPVVLPRCSSVAPDEALLELKVVARRFAIETGIWRETIDLTTVADQASYSFVILEESVQTHPATGSVVHRIVRVNPLDDDGEETSDYPADAYWLDMSTGEINFASQYIPAEADDTIRTVVILRPEWTTAEVNYPDWILDRWGDGLAGGAVARLLARPPASLNPNNRLIMDAQREYFRAVTDAKREMRREGTGRSFNFQPS